MNNIKKFKYFSISIPLLDSIDWMDIILEFGSMAFDLSSFTTILLVGGFLFELFSIKTSIKGFLNNCINSFAVNVSRKLSK